MKKLEDYSTDELKRELDKRQYDEYEEDAKKLPSDDEIYPYINVDDLILLEKDQNENYYQLFNVWVDTGDEGVSYLVKLNHDVFNRSDDDEEKLEKTIKHAFISSAIKDESIDNIYGFDIHINQIGAYGLSYLVIDKPKDNDD